METNRQLKIGKLLQKEISDLFMKEGRDYTENAFLTVTKATVSPDLSVAKVYLSLFKHKDPTHLIRMLNTQNRELRKHLGNRIKNQVRHIPELIFYLDDSLDYVDKMENIFKNLEIPPDTDQKE